MQKAYIILAHKNKLQVLKLINSLNDGKSHFFLHIDLSSELYKERKDIDNTNINIHLVKSVKTAWGSFGLVQATLNCMGEIRKSELPFDRVIILSGQDYPIKSNTYINRFFQASSKKIFIDYSPLPNYLKWDSGGGLYRVTKYFFGLSWLSRIVAKVVNFLAIYVNFLKRSGSEYQHFYGSQWMILDLYTVNYILDFVADNPKYSRFHRFTFAPDELFFHTIILNATDDHILNHIQNDNKMCVIWKESKSPHPEIITYSDLDLINQSNALFARKFDPYVDAAILDIIDHERAIDADENYLALHIRTE